MGDAPTGLGRVDDRRGHHLPGRTRVAIVAGSALATTSRRLGAGGGSTVGGRLTLALDPRALSRLGRGRSVGLVTGTNGKTTTTRFLARALGTGGEEVATNDAGANLVGGLVAALGTAPHAARAALEVDEGYLAPALAALTPRVAVLLNLSRDQLDRIGEVRAHAAAWRRAVAAAPATRVVANADDPLVTWAALGAGAVSWVGTGQRWRADAGTCGACGTALRWGEAGSEDRGGLPWSCPGCGLARPRPEVWLEGDEVVTAGGDRHRLGLALPGWPNRANAAMAGAAATHWGVDLAAGLAAMATVEEVAGRYRWVDVGGHPTRLLLAKNPAGWAEVLDLLVPAGGGVGPISTAGPSGAGPGAGSSGAGASGAGASGAGASGAGASGAGASGAGPSGAGPSGAGPSGAGPSGAGPSGAGPSGAGASGAGPSGAGPSGAGVVVGINARVADGQDPSWLWDVDFERLRGRWVVAAGERAWDLSVRLAYAEVDHATVTRSWAAAVEAAASGGGDAVDVAANYTAFQAARRELAP